jgi:hypothetical protein
MRRAGRFHKHQALTDSFVMNKQDIAKLDPNAELHAFEPLRVALAMGALLLGLLVLGLH